MNEILEEVVEILRMQSVKGPVKVEREERVGATIRANTKVTFTL